MHLPLFEKNIKQLTLLSFTWHNEKFALLNFNCLDIDEEVVLDEELVESFVDDEKLDVFLCLVEFDEEHFFDENLLLEDMLKKEEF